MTSISTSIILVQSPDRSYHFPDAFPKVFRLVGLEVVRQGEMCRCRAHLYHRLLAMHVTWHAPEVSAELRVGELVRPGFPVFVDTEDGDLVVSGLMIAHEPERSLNLFDTVRPEQSGQPELIERARILVEQLSPGYRHLFNAVFWDQRRFARFLRQPGSVTNHHAEPGGLLMHTVDTAEIALKQCERSTSANRDLVLIGALLHDAGKADEYLLKPNGKPAMTDRGRLIGHVVTATEWVAVAFAKFAVDLSDEMYRALIHVLNARKGVPEWVGVRTPVMIECDIVSEADRLSGRINMHERLADPGGGWGKRHPHRPAPFTLPKPD